MPYLQAVLSSALLNLALVLQAIDARKAPSALAMRPGLLFFLMRRWLWMAGNGMSVVGAVLQVLALRRLPVAVVQSIAAGGILLMPLSGMVLLRERPRGLDLVALGAIIGGLAVAMASTPSQGAHVTVSVWALLGATLAVCALGLVIAFRWKRLGTLATAGVCFGLGTVVSKVVALSDGDALRMLAGIALIVATGSVGFLAQTTALQTISPGRVGPVVLAVATALPTFLAPSLFDEQWPTPLVTIMSTIIVIVAAAHLASIPVPSLETKDERGLTAAARAATDLSNRARRSDRGEQ